MGIGPDLSPDNRQEKLIEEVFGKRIVEVAPPLYYKTRNYLAAEKTPDEWRKIPIHDKAEWLAAKRIEAMERTLERYKEVMQRRLKELADKTKPRAPKQYKRRR